MLFKYDCWRVPSTTEEVLNFYIHKSQQQHIFMSALKWKQWNNLLAAQEVRRSLRESCYKQKEAKKLHAKKEHPFLLSSFFHMRIINQGFSFETSFKKYFFNF